MHRNVFNLRQSLFAVFADDHIVKNRSTILYGNTISKWNASIFLRGLFAGDFMNMEFHRWWSILLYRGHVPLSPFLYLSNPFLTFRFYFIFCYLHVCVFPQIIRWSIEIPILSFFLALLFSPVYPCSLYCSVTHKLKFRVSYTQKNIFIRKYSQNRYSPRVT